MNVLEPEIPEWKKVINQYSLRWFLEVLDIDLDELVVGDGLDPVIESNDQFEFIVDWLVCREAFCAEHGDLVSNFAETGSMADLIAISDTWHGGDYEEG